MPVGLLVTLRGGTVPDTEPQPDNLVNRGVFRVKLLGHERPRVEQRGGKAPTWSGGNSSLQTGTGVDRLHWGQRRRSNNQSAQNTLVLLRRRLFRNLYFSEYSVFRPCIPDICQSNANVKCQNTHYLNSATVYFSIQMENGRNKNAEIALIIAIKSL